MKSRVRLAAMVPMASSEPNTGRVVRWLVLCAARRAPPLLRERLAEEWQADLATRRPGLARVRFVIGCCWASILMAHDPLAFGACPAAAGAAGQGSVSLLGAHDSSFFSRRTTVLIIIVCLHAAAIYGLASGFMRPATDKAASPPPLKGHIEDPPVIQQVLLPPLRFTKPDVKVMDPPPLPTIELRPLVVPPTTVTLVPATPPSTEQSGPRAIARVPGGPGKGFPTTREFYSSAAILAEESGVAAIRVCVDQAGRLTTNPVIATSSGYPRLDKDALALARAGSGHYRSTTENGVPVSDCYSYRVRFELQ